MIKKFFLSLSLIVVFAVYSFHEKEEQQRAVILPLQQSSTNSNQSNGQSATTSSSGDTPYKDGSYTGSSADAFYGTIQVKAVIQSGKIADVQFLQYPNDRGTSIMINNQAMPLLKQEAITTQNANVDIVSGATDTSNAFRESLASALSQAK